MLYESILNPDTFIFIIFNVCKYQEFSMIRTHVY